jgi:nitronate monooxygenase
MNEAQTAAPVPQRAMRTRVTELLGIRYPIIQGGMMWVGRAELASAVSNAGGLGILTALTLPTPEALALEIQRCRDMTDRPFGVNLTFLPSITPPPYERYLEVILRARVPVLETAGNNPKDVLPAAKAAGITTIHKCVTIRHAQAAEKLGVDIVSIDGFECAGHPGEDDIGGLVLIPLAARRLRVPIVASGGIGDGHGMAGALALGADGVNLGTRFCATVEAPIHPAIKQALVNATERDTRLVFRTLHNTARVLKNAISDQVVAMESRGAKFEEIRPLVAGARGKAALASGDVDGGVITAGQVVGLIDDVPTCDALVQRMVRECRERLDAARAMFPQSA